MGVATSFLGAMVFTITAVYRVQSAGLSPFQLVLVGTVLEASYFLFEVPTGVLADTYSRRLSVIIGTFLLGASQMIEGAFPVFVVILLSQVVAGLGYTFLSGATEAWLADEVGEEHLGRIFLRSSQLGYIGGFLGTLMGVGLATIRLNLPIVLGGALMAMFGVYLVFAMKEHRFQPPTHEERRSWRTMGRTAREGASLIRGRPVLLTIMAIAVFWGGFSEGFDRLWEAHFLADFEFPALGELQPVVWFGIINIGSMVLGFTAAEVFRRRLDTTSHRAATRTLFVLEALLVASLVAFGLAGSFAFAVAAFWSATLMRSLSGPLYAAWLNQNITPRVRATVLSMNGQCDALGQITVGPGVGAIGSAFGLRAALVTAGAILTPALVLYGATIRRGADEPLARVEAPPAPVET